MFAFCTCSSLFIAPHHVRSCTCVTDPHIFLMQYCQGVTLLGLESFHFDYSFLGSLSDINVTSMFDKADSVLAFSSFHQSGAVLVALGLLMSLYFAEVTHLGRATIASIAPFALTGMTAMQMSFTLLVILWPSTCRLSCNICIFHGTYHHLQWKKDEHPPNSNTHTLYSCFG